MGDDIDMSSLIDQCCNIYATKYCQVNGGHCMHYL